MAPSPIRDRINRYVNLIVELVYGLLGSYLVTSETQGSEAHGRRRVDRLPAIGVLTLHLARRLSLRP